MSSLINHAECPVSTRPHSGGVFALLSLALAAHRQRKALKLLNDATLSDIGLTRAEAEAEANRPFWDVPAHWRR